MQKFLTRAEELLKDDPQAMKAVERLNAAAEKVRAVLGVQSLLGPCLATYKLLHNILAARTGESNTGQAS